MRFKFLAIPLFFMAAAMPFGSLNHAKTTSAAAPVVWNVLVGGGGQGISANGYFPGAITINQGDNIKFMSPYDEPHTVTFLLPGSFTLPDLIIPGPAGFPQLGVNPFAANPTFTGTGPQTFDPTKVFNSGVLSVNDSVQIVFPATGQFTFLCQFHMMRINVNVLPAGAPGTTPQSQLDQQGANQRDLLINQGVQAQAKLKLTSSALPDGSTNWGVAVGGYGNANGTSDIARFTPDPVTINTGDTITWNNNTQTPHTVSFLSGGPDIPLFSPVPAGSGPPFLAFTPAALLPAGGPTYDGTGYVNSGFIGQGVGPASSFMLKFTKPGTYKYICQIHDTVGMVGTIIVTGAAPAPVTTPATGISAPNTGTGDGSAGTGGSGWLYALVAAAGAGLALVAGGGMRLARRRAR